MTTKTVITRFVSASACRFAAAALFGLALAIGSATQAADSGSTTISGIVTSKSTGNGLIGARVEVAGTNLSALVDNTGRYLINVPPGTHELVVTYTGLDEQRASVSVGAGQSVVRNFEMSSAVVMLDAFKVASEKEGLSSAMTQQRNASNLKTIASMDALADLPNMNATELAIRLPGVTFGDPGDEVVEQISVRGMGTGTTSITIDGGGMSSFSAQGRTTRMTAFTGAMFEALELTKGQTPDRPVDSLGGGVNFKTRSPLSMREKRRLNYNLTARMAPWFTEQVPMREERRTHELFNIGYQEKFAVLGSEVENLAVSINGFYSENAFGYFQTNRDFQQTNSQPAFLWDYRTRDDYNNRMQRSISTKWDFRLNRNNLFKLNLIANEAPEPMRRQYNFRAFAGSQTTVPNATTSGVVPGWTDRITTVRAVAQPQFNANGSVNTNTSNTTQPALLDQGSTNIQRDQRLRHADMGGEHTWGPFDVDWAALWSRTRYRTLGNEAGINNRLGNIPLIGPNGRDNSVTPTAASPIDTVVGPNGETGIGWILDRTQDDLYPRFIQNGGLDYTNPKYWRPSVNGLTTSAGNLDIDLIKEVRGNVRYKLPIDSFSAFLKGGYMVRDHNVELYRNNRRWSYIGRNALPNDPSILTWAKVKSGLNVPYWDGNQFYSEGHIVDPSLWREDMYFYYMNRLQATNRTHEVISSYYLMSQGKIGRFGYLAGARRELTDTTGYVNVRAHTLTTAAQQLADPLGSALKDYNNPTKNEGDYGETFPSVHTWYDLTANLKLRGSWTTGMARPSLANAVSSLSITDPTVSNNFQGSVSFGNPALKPTKSQNWDFSLEYYYEPSGSITVGWFHKRMDDYILGNQPIGIVDTGPDNGFNGQYEGYTILSNTNAGSAFVAGWEVAYMQQFRFLPGLLKGLRLQGNWTELRAHGNYGTPGAYFRTKEVNGFIPRTVNLGLVWDYKRISASFSYNFTAESIRNGFNIAQPSRNRYMRSRDLFNMNLRYQIPHLKNVTFNFGVQNIFNEPQRYYRSIPDQMETFLMQGTTITGGIEGRF